MVWAHLIQTRIKKLGACQVLMVRPSADAPASQTRFYLTTRREDTLEQVVEAIAKRWTVETLFADFKELMGSDHYPLHSAEAIRRFWVLGLCLYQYLDSLHLRLERLHKRHVTMGETLNWLRLRHADLALHYACDLAVMGTPSMTILALFAPALRPTATANC